MRSLFSLRFLRTWAVTLGFAVLLLPTLGSGDPMARFNYLGHQLMCSCGCGQILLECNHVGCPLSDGMRNELRAAMDKGDTDEQIYAGFISKYGPTVMAAPVFQGFNILAWVMPGAVLLLGTFGAAFLLHRWKLKQAGQALANAPPSPAMTDDLRERIRREAEHEADL